MIRAGVMEGLNMKRIVFSTFLFLLSATGNAAAAVTEYTNHNDPGAKAAWQAAAGQWSTITFAELPLFTLITDQYADLGVLFTDGSDYTHFTQSFINDGYGLNGALDTTTLQFSQPMHSIAVDFPGGVTFELYYQNQLFYTSSFFRAPGSAGTGGFAGLISDVPFDKVRMVDSGLFIDDLHFGPPIPAPGALPLIAASGLVRRRRRSR